jgi:hypothetical protein
MEMPIRISLLFFLYSHYLVRFQNRPCKCDYSRLILLSLYNGTNRRTACLIFSSRLSFWTAKNMRATTLSDSSLAVVSISSLHPWPGLCIPARCETGISIAYDMLVNKILTLQPDNRWGPLKASQILVLKDFFHRGVDLLLTVSATTFIFQLELDVEPELVVFREYCYYRNWRKCLMPIPSS